MAAILLCIVRVPSPRLKRAHDRISTGTDNLNAIHSIFSGTDNKVCTTESIKT
ncbi:MAG: hypothetical protein Q4E62_03525 [Sutterellaceae bacterium]|nr:hypothetical protein [Sutterellaceae bacterium]